MTCVAFSIKFAKTNQKFAENSAPENSEFCEKIHYYSELFTSLLRYLGLEEFEPTAPEARRLDSGYHHDGKIRIKIIKSWKVLGFGGAIAAVLLCFFFRMPLRRCSFLLSLAVLWTLTSGTFWQD